MIDMKYNVRYRKHNGAVALRVYDETIDPTPSTREGAAALVDRFHAMNVPEVGEGRGTPPPVGTTLACFPPAKTKRL